jgi:hypothetical protein
MKIDENGIVYNLGKIDFSKRKGIYTNRENYFGGVDENGDPVEKTKKDYPYTYSGRMSQWDYSKYEKCRKEAANTDKGELAGYYNNPRVVEKLLQLYFEDQSIKLVMIMEYCNQSSGYPCWRFDYTQEK